jgi:hypothetical protein
MTYWIESAVELSPKEYRDDIAWDADFVVADDAVGHVFAFLGDAGLGERVLIVEGGVGAICDTDSPTHFAVVSPGDVGRAFKIVDQ